MPEIRNQTLTGDQTLDANVYIDCVFENARMNYHGGVPPGFENCSFKASRFSFHGPAAYTLGFLKAMAPARTGMRPMVLNLLPELEIRD
ncbi:hypothetical protein [Brevundimonas sp. FT23028]|uniref:hypothetical protein n=1 Tax=Brevundimonas sp. FT23028 TaxID=3393748 RepID=UPI003B589750